jgi:mono/diheme cytochrome c family protein
MRRFKIADAVLTIMMAIGWALPLAAQTVPADPDRGRTLAVRSCAACHVVAANQRSPAVDGAPPFASFADGPLAERRLRVFLQTPHRPMPDLTLTRREIDDLVAYIMTLRN